MLSCSVSSYEFQLWIDVYTGSMILNVVAKSLNHVNDRLTDIIKNKIPYLIFLVVISPNCTVLHCIAWFWVLTYKCIWITVGKSTTTKRMTTTTTAHGKGAHRVISCYWYVQLLWAFAVLYIYICTCVHLNTNPIRRFWTWWVKAEAWWTPSDKNRKIG